MGYKRKQKRRTNQPPAMTPVHLAQRLVNNINIPSVQVSEEPEGQPSRKFYGVVSILLSVVALISYVASAIVSIYLIKSKPEWMKADTAYLIYNYAYLVGVMLNFAGVAYALSAWYQRDHKKIPIYTGLAMNFLMLLVISAVIIYGTVVAAGGGG